MRGITDMTTIGALVWGGRCYPVADSRIGCSRLILYPDFNDNQNDQCMTSHNERIKITFYGWCFFGVKQDHQHLIDGDHSFSGFGTEKNASDDICAPQSESCRFDTSKPELIPAGWVPEVDYIGY